MDDHEPPHTIPQVDTPMSPDGEERRGAAALSSSSSSSSGLASSVGSSSSSGFSNPKILPSGSSSNFGGGDAEDVKALRDANASATHLSGRVISESDLASAATNDTSTEELHDDAPYNSLLDGMKRRYLDSTAAAASTPIGIGGAMRIRTGKRRGGKSLAVQTAIATATATDMTTTEPNLTPDLQSELVPNLLNHRNSHRNGNSHHSPTVQFGFLDEEAMPARASDEPASSSNSGGGNVLQRARQVLMRGGGSGNKHSAPSTAAAVSQPQSSAKIRTKGLQPTKTKRGGRRLSDSATLITTGKRQPQGRQGKRLSLSEYRKADESSAVRLTDSDPNQCIHSAYDLTESPQCCILGHGSSSTVRLAVRRSDATLVAVKCLSKFEIMSSRRAGGGRESTRTSPVRQHHRRPRGPLLGGGGRRSHRRLDECEVLRALGGVPNVTHLLDVYEDDDEVQLVLEYCPGGELFDAIHRRRQLAAAAAQDIGRKRSRKSKTVGSGYTEREAAMIVGQLLEALAALHERGIVHRDIKPENVFLMSTTSTTSNDANANDLEVRLSDFGLARYLHRPSHQRVDAADDASSSSTASSSASGGESPITPQSVLRAQRGRAYSSVGSDFYAAPEVENGSGYDTQCDVYSLGVTLYILLGGFPPRQRKQRSGSLDAYDATRSMLESRTSSSSEGDSSSSSSSGEEDDADGTNPISVTFPGSHWKHASSGAKDLIRQMMHSDPNVRITARDALQHEWILQHFTTTATAKTVEGQPSRAPGQKKRSSLVLSSASTAPCDSDDRPNFRRKLSNLNLCDMASDEGIPDPSPVSNTAAVPPTVAAAMPPPMSFGQAAFSMAELYNRMSLVADATTDEVNVDEEIVEDEGMDANAASTPERAVTTTATVPLST